MMSFAGDLIGPSTALPHFWEHTVGSGHATLGLRSDWQAQLKRTHDELGMRHVRFHGLLSDDMGTLICQGGALLYSFFNADQIFDFLLSIGMKPFVELSFMPSALSSGDSDGVSLSGERERPARSGAMGGADQTLGGTLVPIGTASRRCGNGSSRSGTSRT